MKRIAQVKNNTVYYIFEAEEMPTWPPDSIGLPTLLVDITDRPEVQPMWDYDPDTDTFTKPVPEPTPEPQPMPEPPLDPSEEMQAQTLLNNEYLVILAEIDNML